MKRFVVMIVGIIFVLVSCFLYYKNNNLTKNCTVLSEAIVVDMKEELSSDNDFMYYPIIEYKVNNNTIRETIDHGYSSPEYNLGDKITILYNPKKTNEFIIKDDKSSIIFCVLFGIIGLFTTVYGIILAIKNK